MLIFPLPPVPTDPSQPIDTLSPRIHQQISSWLDHKGCSLELLDMVMKTVNPGCLIAHQGDCTSAQLFSKLSRFNCTIGVLAFFLEKCQMFEPLYLFKERIPVVVKNDLPQETVVTMNTRVKLGCEVSTNGFPKPTFKWFLNDAPLLATDSATLVIPNFRNSDAGFYKCEITQQCRDGNFQTISTGPSKITVEDCAPFVVTEPQDISVNPGDSFELNCVIEGNPIPHFQWYKNDYLISNEVTLKLQISYTVPQHSGRYRCLATNSEGKILTRDALVEVKLPPPTSIRPTFTDYPTQPTASMKQALLIGNWTYDAHGLRKVRADVKTLNDILYNMDFEVISLCNLGKGEILHAVDRLCELLIPDSYVVVYFAGHGIHYAGHDYLMPVDLNMNSDYSARDLVDGNEIIARIQQTQPKLLVILLDMCRIIPQQGINLRIADELPRQVPRDSRSNLVMAWATAENSFAFEMSYEENGIFMTYMKRAMENRNILVSDMLERLKQHFRLEIPVEARDQMPITTSSLAEPLSLYDPVDGNIIGDNLWNNSQMLARNWKILPTKQIATIQANNGCLIIIHIEFGLMDDCFSNGLKIELTTEGSEIITFQPSIYPPILELLEVKHQLDLKRCTITVHKLQSLMEDASLLLRTAEFPNERILVHIGQPLIAVARLSTNQL